MSTELEPDLQLEIAHVLFVDIVGYSKLLINEQHESLAGLNQAVRNTDAFRVAEAAGKLIRLPTGDGMALAFTSTPDAPVRCALQTGKALRRHPELKVRMGVHSGPVSGMTDVNLLLTIFICKRPRLAEIEPVRSGVAVPKKPNIRWAF